MISRPSVLILGAGASVPYGFPSGERLIWEIYNQLHPHNTSATETLEAMGFTITQQDDFVSQLHDANPSSIDTFLQERPQYSEIGKAAIATFLVPYENLINLKFMDRELRIEEQGKRWYKYLLDLLGDLEDDLNELSIFTFNYDRSLEYFMFETICARTASRDAAIRFFQHIPIIHVYGQLGKPRFLDPNGREYDGVTDANVVRSCVSNIHLMFDEDPLSEALNMYTLLDDAALVAFIGFGYHPRNLQRLMLREHCSSKTRIVATFYGMADGEKSRAMLALKQYSTTGNPGPECLSIDADALGFFKDFDYLK